MLTGILPAPKHNYGRNQDEDQLESSNEAARVAATLRPKSVPQYLHRKNFVPSGIEDFGDGGAFPEIHVVQYPLDMGKPGAVTSAIVAVTVGESGLVKFDAIVKQGSNRNRIVQSSLDDIKAKEADKDMLALPQDKEEQETAEKTRLALEVLLGGKIKSALPSTVNHTQNIEKPDFIRYTPDPNAPGYSEGAKERIIRMVEAQVDPMEPPKHLIKKCPRGPPSPPVPILHSPPRKLTAGDKQAWKVPPCVSNWKNARGYTIPLDKRLAADGRGLMETTINNKFATLSESLYVAERKASEDLRIRNQIRKKMAMREKEDREKDLRDMALQARMGRAGVDEPEVEDFGEQEFEAEPVPVAARGPTRQREEIDEPPSESRRSGGDHYGGSSRDNERRDDRDNDRHRSDREGRSDRDDSRRDRHDRDEPSRGHRDGSDRRGDRGDDEERAPQGETNDESVARQQRERLRQDRRKERERDIRLENMKGNMRKNKVDRDEGRDVSERIALGMLKGTGNAGGEAQYDSRLFNQSAGMDSGFAADDEYSTYSKPLFDRSEASTVYRPKKDDSEMYGDVDEQMSKLSDTSKFKADKGFKGADSAGGMPRDAPVQFERAREEDPFGINDIVSSGKNKKPRHD
mmetsp:Transcript_4698/g.4841  ORF Transcript_4698/g.4841 Transcript_4698/m.4841 type:complete len:632 (-) Transcript_4698:159-2054(-)|eukprot:CAMPEP_0119037958 /NCGR_PEP_ID=MMETSP1177-20130426/6548_1 /TAXON_ID=2985 /ORGANISM="Ochromonas sp, Strain CCMP1899" /LENGTH=631 /DNA_ID=CAMNT_0006999845 /DNA_START=119 /DNA_END=2014 /DNA_ORIENTATION=-